MSAESMARARRAPARLRPAGTAWALAALPLLAGGLIACREDCSPGYEQQKDGSCYAEEVVGSATWDTGEPGEQAGPPLGQATLVGEARRGSLSLAREDRVYMEFWSSQNTGTFGPDRSESAPDAEQELSVDAILDRSVVSFSETFQNVSSRGAELFVYGRVERAGQPPLYVSAKDNPVRLVLDGGERPGRGRARRGGSMKPSPVIAGSSALLRLMLGALLACASACKDDKLEHVRPVDDSGASEEDTPSGPAVLRINEVRSSEPGVIELINTGGEAAELQDMVLEFSTGCRTELAAGGQLSGGTRIELRQDTTIACDFPSSGGVRLIDPKGQELDAATWVSPLARRSWCRIPDGEGEFTTCSESTPGRENRDENLGEDLSPVWSLIDPDGWGAIAASGDGRTVWVSVPARGELHKINLGTGEREETLAPTELSGATAEDPTIGGIATLEAGSLVVSNPATNSVLTLEPTGGGPARELVSFETNSARAVMIAPDGAVVLSMARRSQVRCYEGDGTLRWAYEPVESDDFQTPRQLAWWNEHVLVAATQSGTVGVIDPSSGALVGHISDNASPDATDSDRGTVSRRLGGLAVVASPPVVLLADAYDGPLLGFDSEDPAKLLDEEQDWAYIGAVGRLGELETELAGAQRLFVAAEQNLLVVIDYDNRRLRAFNLGATLSLLSE